MMKCKRLRRLICLGLILISITIIPDRSTVNSADYDDRSVTATILTALGVSSTQDLKFGTVLSGVPKSFGYSNNDSSAIFTITGQASAGISMYMTLPQYLSLSDASDRMPIIFSSTSAAIDTTTVTPATVGSSNGWINQNPYSLPSGVIVGSGGTTKLYLGGKVVPSTNQKTGSYSGDIVLNVSYNGT